MTIHERVTVKGGRVEVRHPDLPEGAEAEVIILVEPYQEELPPLASFLGQGRGCFSNAEEIDDFIRSEREAWES
jgi:hypothetical protein